MKEEVNAIPCNRPIIIRGDKVEEFLNMKTDEKIKEEHRKRVEKFKHLVTDNTKK